MVALERLLILHNYYILKFPGLSNHPLNFKVGASIILLTNLNHSLGLDDGTRMIVHKMGNRVIEATMISWSNNNDMVLVPCNALFLRSSHNNIIYKEIFNGIPYEIFNGIPY